jgi:basic membrane protein A
MKRVFMFLAILALCAGFVWTSSAQEKLKAAFVYVGPIGDGGWTYAHNDGRQALEKMGVETAYVESVPEGAEAEKIITRFAAEGYDLVFTTSYGFMDPTVEVAKKFPKVIFGHCSGYKRAKNVFTYFGRMYQPKYLAGMIAGKMSKTGKIGFVAPHPIPEVIRHINAFTLGVRSVNQSAKVHVVWTGAWFDPGKERDAAVALMDAGCDIIATGADSPASMQAAEKRGFYSFGYDSDGRAFAPRSFLTAPIWDWSVIYNDIVEKMKEGFTDWENLDYWDGLESGVVKLATLSDLVPDDVRKIVEARAEEIKKDDNIFVGPIKDQSGAVKVKDGVKLTDAELLSMMWFVEGVVGNIPE